MSNIDQISFPSNYDSVTSSILLTQPEPQFLYAQMFMSALQVSLDVSGENLSWRQGMAPGPGVAYSPAERDRLKMSDPMFSSVFAAKADFSAAPGSIIKFNRPSFATTTYTLASREIGLNSSISTTPMNITGEQVSLTLQRYAGPYNTVTSGVAPFGVDRFSDNRGTHSVGSMVETHLKRDMSMLIEKAVVSLLDTGTAVYPVGMTANNDATVVGQFPMDLDVINRAERLADDANLPTFPDGFRALVVTPTQAQQLKGDPDFIEYAKEDKYMSAIFSTYLTTINKLHVFKSTTLSTTNNSSSVAIHHAHLIAPGALLGGMGERPRISLSSADNYGETKLYIWIAYLALGLADNRFCLSIRTSA